MGVLPINVEVGRYRSIPLGNKLCDVCDANAVETEIHFLLYYSLYKDERSKLLNCALSKNRSFNVLNDISKMSFLFKECTRQTA